MVVELMENLGIRRAGGIIIAVLHRMVNAAGCGVAENIIIRGLGCLGLALSGFRSYRGRRIRVPFRVSVINSVRRSGSGNTSVGVRSRCEVDCCHDCVGFGRCHFVKNNCVGFGVIVGAGAVKGLKINHLCQGRVSGGGAVGIVEGVCDVGGVCGIIIAIGVGC